MPWRGGIAVVRSFAGSFDAGTSTIQEIRVILKLPMIADAYF